MKESMLIAQLGSMTLMKTYDNAFSFRVYRIFE